MPRARQMSVLEAAKRDDSTLNEAGFPVSFGNRYTKVSAWSSHSSSTCHYTTVSTPLPVFLKRADPLLYRQQPTERHHKGKPLGSVH